jgi:hypothetical protein
MPAGEGIKSYKDLEVWQMAMSPAERCYRATKEVGRVSLLRRDALSGLLDECERTSKMLRSMIRSLETRS